MLRITAAVALVATLTCPAVADQPAPLRHLVYTFELGISSNFEAADNMISSTQLDDPGHRVVTGVGSSRYVQSAGERGTISVDVLQKQQDDGLVLTISEQTKDARSAEAATCVVYGDETMMCDQSKRINPEETALLYILGVNFVNATRMDDKQRWQYARSQEEANIVDDLQIAGHTGSLLNVAFHRIYTIKGGAVERTVTDGTIDYNPALMLPVALTQDQMTDRPSGSGLSQRVEQRLSLKLLSDSKSKP